MFTFFYVYVAFDPHQQADLIRKQGGFVPGSGPVPDRALLRPHPQPDHRGGAVFLGPSPLYPPSYGAVASQLVPLLRDDAAHLGRRRLETMRQIDSQLMMRNYEGFLK